MRINPAVRWIKPKSPEGNGFGSEVYICSEGKELDTHHPVIKLVASLARNRGVTFTEIHNTPSNNSQYAFLLLNEVLATALGNGYSYKKLKGSVDNEDWYYTKYVNLLAREIYPVICNYLAQGKTIDEEFIKTYVSLYDAKFSSWSKELDNILTYRAILCDDINDTRYFRRNYPYSIHKTILDLSAKSIGELQKLPLTKVIIISGDHINKFKTLKNHFAELKGLKFNPKLEFITTVDLKDRTKMLIINRHTTTVETLMTKAFSERKIN